MLIHVYDRSSYKNKSLNYNPLLKNLILYMCKIIYQHITHVWLYIGIIPVFILMTFLLYKGLGQIFFNNCLIFIPLPQDMYAPLIVSIFTLPQDECAPPAVPGHQWTGRGTDRAVQLQDTGVHGGRKIVFFPSINSLCMTKKGTHIIKTLSCMDTASSSIHFFIN